MKIVTSIVFSLLITATALSQNFEGKIVYLNSYKSKLPNVSDAQFTALLGSKQDYFIKGGNYKSVSNGTSLVWQIYKSKDNKLYNKIADAETISWVDGGTLAEPVLKIIHNKDVIEIQGYRCDEMILKSKGQTEKYYFNSKLGVDAALYSKHLFGNWYEYLKVAKSLPLKMVVDNSSFTMTSIATEIRPMSLDENEFQLPADSKVAKSPN